jgi:polyphosphate kinase 2 (PPK2 family)
MGEREQASRVVVVLEGRDGSGKTTTARDLVHALGHGVCRVVALPPPTEAERRRPYFSRWLEHLPEPGRVIVFDRSWYNRAVVERVMDFATPAEVEAFYEELPRFEAELARRGVRIVKMFFTIGEKEQARRLEGRRVQGRLTAVDAMALFHSEAYARAEEEMLARTSTPDAPWVVLPEWERSARLETLLEHVNAARNGDHATGSAHPTRRDSRKA